MNAHPIVGVIGGTGKLGAALVRRWAKAGLPVLIGSRSAERAAEAAKALALEVKRDVGHGANADVAARAEIIVVTVPWDSQTDTLNDIRAGALGKLVVDATVPLVPPKVMRVQLPPEGSAALRAQKILGEGVTLASAFHSVAAHKLAKDIDIDCDVLIFSDDKAARARVALLAQAAGLRGVQAGPLANSVAAEALTSVLIFISKMYKADGPGIRVTGDLIAPEA